ncbi:MAG: efflux transporter outer membrane subunit [bacterium]
MRRPVPGLFVAALTLAGCGSAPPVRAPEIPLEMPATWTADTSATAASDVPAAPPAWWDSFDDPRLADLVDEALANNHDLAAAAARVEAAAAQARVSGASLWPQASASGRAARQQQVFVGLPIPSGSDGPLTSRSTTYGVSLDLSWEIDLWGRLRAGASAAKADWQAAAIDWQGARLSLAAQTIKSWFAALEAQRQFELANDTAASFRRTAESIRARYERGSRTSLDVRLAEVDLAAAERSLASRQLAAERTRRQLEILLGRYPAGKLAPGGELVTTGVAVPAGLPSDLLARRPDIAAAERRVAAANRRVAESRGNLLPRLSLTASGGRSSSELSDLTSPDFDVWNLVGNLVQPLFQGGRLRAQLARSHAQEDEAVQSYASTVLRACGEVETALLADRLLAEEERAAGVVAEQARAAREDALRRYEGGLIDVIPLLDAQRSAANAESALLDVRRRRLDARVDLHLALGGGFDGPAAGPIANPEDDS